MATRNIRIKLARDIKFVVSDKPFAGLVVRADKVTIEPKVETSRPTIKLEYLGGTVLTPCVAVTIQAFLSTVSGIRFFVDARKSEAPMVGLQIEGGKQHKVSSCEFKQANPIPSSKIG